MAPAEVVVIGVGNTLLADEGFGIYVVRELKRAGVPEGVEAVEAGVTGFSLLDLLAGVSKAILVDVVEMGMEPGRLVRFTPQEVASTSNAKVFSLHQIDLLEVLELARALGQGVETVIIGVQPERVAPGEGLSSVVQAKVQDAVRMVRSEIEGYFARESSQESS